MKIKQLSSLDVNQIIKHQYEEDMNAQRVVIVGQDMSSLAESIKESVKEGLKNINFDLSFPKQEQPLVIETEVIVKEPQIIEVEKVITIYETKIVEIEKIVIVKEPQIVEIEKPMIIIEPKIIEIERPVFIDRIKVDIPGWFKFLICCETIILLGVILSYVIKGH